MKSRLAVVLGVFLLAVAFPAPAATTTQVRLLLAAEAARPGDTVLAAVHLRMAPGWHTYWRFGGDSGGPTTVKWDLPAGVTAGEIQWPVPEKLKQDDLITYVHHGEILLLIPLQLAANLAPGPLELKAKISWLECEKLCIPGKGEVSAKLIIGGETKPSADTPAIEAAKNFLPQSGAALGAKALWDGSPADDPRALIIEWNSTAMKEADFFPYSSDTFEVQSATDRLPDDGGKIRLRKKVKKTEGNWPAEIMGIVVTGEGSERAAYEVKLAPATGAGSSSTSATSAGKDEPLWLQLIYAFIGGLILNIMPCVLPVISLKIFGFIRQSGESPARLRALGLAYGAGVLLSLLALAMFVIGLQQAGKSAGWGVQFQNPIFVVAVTTLVVLVALNLFGLFEVTLGGGAMGAASSLAAREGMPGAFFNGGLAVVLATPCTAPFLASALGYAFRQSPAVIALFFLTIGLGLASPYVVLCFAPKLLRFLPKPGAWMEKFKIALGFPVLATAIWLFSVGRELMGKEDALWFGLFLVVLALGAWVWGEFVQRGSARRGLAMVLSLGMVLGFGAYAALRAPPTKWEVWSTAALEKARATGRPVLVDFTADWCLTCQANKKTSIDVASVQAKLKDIKAVMLLGDYTREDPAITAELKKFNRAGVPLVLVYPRDKTAPPLVLPEILTPGIMLDALEKAGK
ncbi:MAG: thioredoxin family protein [Verrucomicrobia bacterium]|nr:thioredoxin family protein [Verrucomicrobiota bacterium]